MARPRTKAGVMMGKTDSGPRRCRVQSRLRDSKRAKAKPRLVEIPPTITARNRLFRSAPRPRASMVRKERLGGSGGVQVNVRVVAASNRDLEAAAGRNEF